MVVKGNLKCTRMFGSYWDNVERLVYKIPADFMPTEDRKRIEELRALKPMQSLSAYLTEHPFKLSHEEGVPQRSFKNYLFQVVTFL